MNSAYIKFLKQLLVFSGVLGAFGLAFMFVAPVSYSSPALPFLFVFFIAATLLSFYYLLQAASKRFIKFVNTFFLIMIFKLFIYAGVMIAYVLFNRGDAVPFMLGFFILYLCYTVFESASIIKYTQPRKPDQAV